MVENKVNIDALNRLISNAGALLVDKIPHHYRRALELFAPLASKPPAARFLNLHHPGEQSAHRFYAQMKICR